MDWVVLLPGPAVSSTRNGDTSTETCADADGACTSSAALAAKTGSDFKTAFDSGERARE
jgi:hypothetical protein